VSAASHQKLAAFFLCHSERHIHRGFIDFRQESEASPSTSVIAGDRVDLVDWRSRVRRKTLERETRAQG